MSNSYQNLYQSAADNAAANYGIPQSIFSSLISTESSWNPHAISTTSTGQHAYGLTQLMPATAQSVGALDFMSNPVANLNGGAKYLAQQYAKYGNWTDALAAYNAGTPSSSAGQSYAAKVLQGAGYAPGTQGGDPISNWFGGLLDSVFGKGTYSPSDTSPVANSTKSQAAHAVDAQASNDVQAAKAALNPSTYLTDAKNWVFGQGVPYLLVGAGLIFMTYFALRNLFNEGKAA
jgi:hypothetical protein